MTLLKKSLIILAIIAFGVSLWFFSHTEDRNTLDTLLTSYDQAGVAMKQDLTSIASLPITEDQDAFHMEDTGRKGIDIQYANTAEASSLEQPDQPKQTPLTISFPKDTSKPLEVKLDDQRVITIQDERNQGFKPTVLTDTSDQNQDQNLDPNQQDASWYQSLFKKLSPKKELIPKTYLAYQGERKTLLYTFKKDQATDEKKLKSWTLYQKGNGIEQESYHLENAKVKINDNGDAEVFYFGDQELKNQEAEASVEPSLMERAQRTLAKEMGEDILNGGQSPDFTIPKPFFFDKNGEKHDATWGYDESSKTLSLELSFKDDLYPIALDPTLSFTAPAQSNTGDVITGETTNSYFGRALASGDFNADGKTDLAVGAYGYSTNTGRAYIFYQDGEVTTRAASADVVITGEAAGNYFGVSLTSGDFNADGKIDLVVGAYSYSSAKGRLYIFYNDGSIPTTAASADAIITGRANNDSIGFPVIAGDFNADGRTDIATDGDGYSLFVGRAYIFYNNGTGSYPATSASADVTITGEATGDFFGTGAGVLVSGDFNADGRIDLAIGAYGYSTNTGRAYIFYNDGSIPTTAATADVTITGETTSNSFGYSMTAGDFNADGKTDLAVGAYTYSSNSGRAYIFYNDGSIPTTAATADVTISAEASSNLFGKSLVSGDFNTDGKTDLVIGAPGYSSNTGRAYIFYNDGSIPTTAATADVIITGETASDSFGNFLTSGDFNADGKIDLVVGDYDYSSDTGRAYIFYSQNGQVNTNRNIVGETTSNYFGSAFAAGDFNSDGRTDLAVGAYGYSTNTGRVYIFYGDGQIPGTAATADVTITGETTNNYFGSALTSGDLNADGKTDLAVGAYGYSTNTGRTYIFYNDGSIPTTAATADVTITGEASSSFGIALTTGDLNTDSKTDLAVGANAYSTNTGRAYIFYNDGSIPTTAATADVTITGGASSYFGGTLVVGDFNTDGRADIVIDSHSYGGGVGYVHIFYNDGSIPTTSGAADITITDGNTSSFGQSIASGDLNADGRTDLIVGGPSWNGSRGIVYVFYNDGSIPTISNSCDAQMLGTYGIDVNFGNSLTTGDFNADGRTDIAVGAYGYSTNTGRAYIFYGDGSIPAAADTADVIITGETTNNSFGAALASGDFNADGRTDLVVGANGYTTNTGKIYFYETRENFSWKLERIADPVSGLRTSTNGSGQEMKITGETASDQFGYSLVAGDLNADGKTDLVVSAYTYSSNTGRAYIFYNDGSFSPSANSADAIITGEGTSNSFGYAAMAVGDFNADGKTDLAVGAYAYNSFQGRAYIFYNDGAYPASAANADVIITGEGTFNYFGCSLASGDLNADGKTDLLVGAYRYSSYTGRAYIFYNDGSIPTAAGSADVIITGETASDQFGYSLVTGDLNADGKTDLAVGANYYSTFKGRVYLFYADGTNDFGTATCSGTPAACSAANADVVLTNAAATNIGSSFAIGDLNADGKKDLIVGTDSAMYIFYVDGTNDFGTTTCSGTPIACNIANADVIITGVTSAVDVGDFNADGRTDLAVGGRSYSSNTGQVYIFYNDGSIPTTAATADVTITGEATSNYFGRSVVAGDFNADGKTDLAVGANGYGSDRGRVYMYTWNDSTITGETTSNYFGYSLASGDFNADGKTDLAVGAHNYSSSTGRAYIFYNDGSIPTTAATADVTITGEAGSRFSISLASGDFNADGTTDLAVGAFIYSSSTGRAYIFYNDGSIPTTAATADVTITGEATSNYFGRSVVAGDFNADGRTDLAVGAYLYSSFTGRAYIFYNDGSIPTTAATADVTITGEAGSRFSISLASGDFNADGKTDLAVGAYNYSSSTGRAYIFYNDGSIPTTAATADVTITGETTSNFFGYSLASGDFNADGKTDLAVGAYNYSSSTGRAYIFYNDGSIPTTAATADVTITGNATSDSFGTALISGDFNADGRIDLAVGASGYSTNTGRAYIFYNDGSIPTTAATADVTITGETTSNYFGASMISGDFNADGKTDLAVGAYLYSSSTGRAYIFITEAKVAQSGGVTTRGTAKIKGSFIIKK